MGLLTLFCKLRIYNTTDQMFSYNFEINIFVEGNVYVVLFFFLACEAKQVKFKNTEEKNIKLLNNGITIEDILIGCALQC